MPQLTSLLTAAALLVHLLAGCCWHHAHASPVEVATSPACCHHDGAGHASHEPSDPSHHEPCEEGRCVTILSAIEVVSAPWDLPSPPCPDDTSALTTVSLISICAVPSNLAEPARPPLTPVAMHQSLRI